MPRPLPLLEAPFMARDHQAYIRQQCRIGGCIRPTSANNAGLADANNAGLADSAFDPHLWSTFVSTMLGLEVPVLSSLPSRNNSPL
jgi:hypothetical protein